MVINLEQKKIHFDLRFILIYNIYTHAYTVHACIYIHTYVHTYIHIYIFMNNCKKACFLHKKLLFYKKKNKKKNYKKATFLCEKPAFSPVLSLQSKRFFSVESFLTYTKDLKINCF